MLLLSQILNLTSLWVYDKFHFMMKTCHCEANLFAVAVRFLSGRLLRLFNPRKDKLVKFVVHPSLLEQTYTKSNCLLQTVTFQPKQIAFQNLLHCVQT